MQNPDNIGRRHGYGGGGLQAELNKRWETHKEGPSLPEDLAEKDPTMHKRIDDERRIRSVAARADPPAGIQITLSIDEPNTEVTWQLALHSGPLTCRPYHRAIVKDWMRRGVS